MDANAFLNAKTFTFSEEVKIEPLDPKTVDTVTTVNLETIDFIQSETLDGLLNASATADSTVQPDHASYQPLNEAGLMTAGNSVTQSAVGANVNNALGIQNQSLDNLDTAGQVVPPQEGVEEQPDYLKDTREAILQAQTTISSALVGVSNNADKAEGAQKISSPTQLEVGGNSVYFVSESMLHTTSPVISTTADVISIQSKTYQITADLVTESLKNRYSNIEGTDTNIANNRITTTLGRDIKVSSEINETALTNYTINADVMETYSQSLIELRSTKSTRITADENIVNQAGNISITASPGSKKNVGKKESPGELGNFVVNKDGTTSYTTTNAAGDQVKFDNVVEDGSPKWKSSGAHLEGVASNPNPARSSIAKGNISILANGEGAEGGTFTIVNTNQITSSQENQTNLAKNVDTLVDNAVKTTGKKISSEANSLASISSGRNIQFSTSSSMTLMTGGQTFQGLRRSDIGKMTKLVDIGGPIDLKEIPKLPKLPAAINAQALKDCIKKGSLGGLEEKVKDIFEDTVEDVNRDAQAIIEAGKTLLGLGNENEDSDFNSIKLNKKAKKKQKVQAPTVAEAARREKSHPKPTGKDVTSIQGSLEESSEGDPGSVKLPKIGPLGETTSPTGQSTATAEHQVIGAAGVIEGGTDIFLPDEEASEDLLDLNKLEDVKGSGDELDNVNDLEQILLGAIDNLDIIPEESSNSVYQNYAIDFVSKYPNYKLEASSELEGTNIFENSLKDLIIKYLKGKYVTTVTEDLVFNEEENIRFNEYSKNTELNWVNYLDEQIKQIVAIGGAFTFAKKAIKYVKHNINISDNLDDLKSGNTQRVLGGLSKSLSPSIGGNYFTDAESIIKQSSFLQGVYTNVSTTFNPYAKDPNGNIKLDTDGNPVLNSTNNVEGFINALDISGMQKLLETAADTIGIKNIEISENLIKGIEDIKASSLFQEEGYSINIEKIIINLLQQAPGVTQVEAEEFHDFSKREFQILLEGDLKSATSNLVLDEILSGILGPANTQAIKDLSRLYTSTKQTIVGAISKGKEAYKTGKQLYNDAGELIDKGEDLYTAIKAAPAIISMMNYYEVPTLNQVSTLLTCLDIKNNVKDVMQNVKDLSGSLDKLKNVGENVFDILGDVFGESSSELSSSRITNLINKAGVEPQSTPRIITVATNPDIFAKRDIMSDLTGGMVSGSIASNPQDKTSIPSDYFGNITEDYSEDISNSEETLVKSYLDSKSINTLNPNKNVCPEPYDAFADTNESSNPADWQSKITDEQVLKVVETLPRLTQLYNSILELPEGETVEGLTQEQIIDIKNTKINIKLDPCFSQVKLNAVESNIEIIEIKNGALLFKMQQKDLLSLNNKDIIPGTNTLLQLYIEEFYDLNKNRPLRVERTKEFYTPVAYNFKVVKYNLSQNIGLAQLIPTQSRIYLRSTEDNLIYNYSILDIGSQKLQPQVLDSYAVL